MLQVDGRVTCDLAAPNVKQTPATSRKETFDRVFVSGFTTVFCDVSAGRMLFGRRAVPVPAPSPISSCEDCLLGALHKHFPHPSPVGSEEDFDWFHASVTISLDCGWMCLYICVGALTRIWM